MILNHITKTYLRKLSLKYGCNPHQNSAGVFMEDKKKLPFKILNGEPGYLNLLDGLNGWQLVRELRLVLGLPAAASFKHVSPAGVGLSGPLSAAAAQACEVDVEDKSPLALAYIKARGGDPISSFGDFAALSDPVDMPTANLLRQEVSDGIIAPGYDAEALAVLKKKKKGRYIIIQIDPEYEPPAHELREIFGVTLQQETNQIFLAPGHIEHTVTKASTLPSSAKRDMLLAAMSVKYTQSNSVGYVRDGQILGLAAGQQSRIDCTRLAGSKTDIWFLRQHPKTLGLRFRPEVKRVERINARIRYIQQDFTALEKERWESLFAEPPPPWEAEEKIEWIKTLDHVSLASDGFFPFRDNIDQVALRGVKYIIQPGGSIADDEIKKACDEYNIAMVLSGLRLFHH